MKHLLCLALLVVTPLNFASAAEAVECTYYVQLIRGNDDDKPPVTEAKPIGPKLAVKFRSVFKWKSYWEVNRQQVKLARGQKSKLKLNKDREVEIDLTDPTKRKVTAYSGGKLAACTTQPMGETMTIIGGDRVPNSVWFIVVRRDKPSTE